MLEAKERGFTDSQIEEMIADSIQDMSKWSNLQPEDIPTSTDMISWNKEEGATVHGNSFAFADTADRMYDRKGIRGTKLPAFVAGSNEFVAESSANTQAKFYSVQLGNGQENLKRVIEWVFRGFLRSMGIRDDPIFSTKRVNAVERLEEARAFEAIMTGIKVAIDAGLSLPLAIELYEEETGSTFSGKVKQMISEEIRVQNAE